MHQCNDQFIVVHCIELRLHTCACQAKVCWVVARTALAVTLLRKPHRFVCMYSFHKSSDLDAHCTANAWSVRSCAMLRQNLCQGCSSSSSSDIATFGSSTGTADRAKSFVSKNAKLEPSPDRNRNLQQPQAAPYQDVATGMCPSMCLDPFQYCMDNGIEEDLECPWFLAVVCDNCVDAEYEFGGPDNNNNGAGNGGNGGMSNNAADAVGADSVGGDDVDELAIMQEAQQTVRQYIEANPTNWWEKKGTTTTIEANEETAVVTTAEEGATIINMADAPANTNTAEGVTTDFHLSADASTALCARLCVEGPWTFCDEVGIEDDLECPYFLVEVCDSCTTVEGVTNDVRDTISNYVANEHYNWWDKEANEEEGPVINNYSNGEQPEFNEIRPSETEHGGNGGGDGASTRGVPGEAEVDILETEPMMMEVEEEELVPEDAAAAGVESEGVPEDAFFTEEPTGDSSFEPTLERVPTTSAPNAVPLDTSDEFTFVPNVPTAVPTSMTVVEDTSVPTASPMLDDADGEDEEGEDTSMPTSSAVAKGLPRFTNVAAITTAAWVFGGRRAGVGVILLSSLATGQASVQVESRGIPEEAMGTDEPTATIHNVFDDSFEPTMERVPTTSVPNAEPLDASDEFTFVPNVPTAAPTVAGEDAMVPTGIGTILLSTMFSSAAAQDCVRQGVSQCSSTANIPQLNCCEGLTCHPFIGCFPSPRQIGNPCLLTYGQPCTGDKCCDEGLTCAEAAFSAVPNVGECKCASSDPKECRGTTTGGYNVVIVPAPTPAEETEVKQIDPVPTTPAPVNPPPTLAPVTPPPTPVPTAKPVTAPPTPKPTESFSDLCQQVICFDPNGYCDMNQIGLSECSSLVQLCECFPPTPVPTPNPTKTPSAAPQTSAPVSSPPTMATVVITDAPVTMSPTKVPTKTPSKAPTAAPVEAEEEKEEIVVETTDAPTTSPVEFEPMPCQEERQKLQDCIEANDCDISGECDGNFGLCGDLLPFYCCQVKQCLECDVELAAEAMCISDGIRAMSGSDSCGLLVSSDCEVDGVDSPNTEAPTASDTEAPSKDVTNAPTPTPEPTFFPTADDETSSASAISSTGIMVAFFASTIAIAAQRS